MVSDAEMQSVVAVLRLLQLLQPSSPARHIKPLHPRTKHHRRPPQLHHQRLLCRRRLRRVPLQLLQLPLRCR